jgi:DNA-binding beta-propeller fold protein YncE
VGLLPVGFIPVELEGPHHLSADPAGQFVYVNLSEAVSGSGGGPHGAHGTGTIPGYVLRIGTADGLQSPVFARVDPNPGDNTLSADGSTLYVTHYDLVKLTRAASSGDLRQADTNLAVVETATMSVKQRVPLCPVAHGARLSADGTRLFSTCGTDELAVVHLDDPSLPVQRVPLPGTTESFHCSSCPYALGVAPDKTVWVSSLGAGGGSSGGGGVDVYDPVSGAFDPARHLGVCGRALFAAFGPDSGSGYQVYVPEQGGCGDVVHIYQPGAAGTAPTLVDNILLPAGTCLNAHMMRVSEDGASAQLVCEGDHVGPGSLVFLDLRARTVVGSAPLGVFPDGLVLVPARPQ